MATVRVGSNQGLLDAIEEYGAGDTIICGDGGDRPGGINPPAGTHLNGEGVTVRCDYAVRSLFELHRPAIVENIRFLGSRYDHVIEHGWWDYEVSGTAWNYGAECINVRHSDVEIRHCEFEGWTHTGVQVGRNNGSATLSPHIWGNRFENNNCRALGYGVVVQGGDALIEWNYFNNNRHDIAGGDWEGVSYEARYNHFGPIGRIYGTECHPPGGRRIHVHHNTFEDKHGNTPRKGFGRKILIRNRGVPSQWGHVHNNWFKGEMTVSMSSESRRKYTFENNHEGESEPADDIGQPRPPEVEPGLAVGGTPRTPVDESPRYVRSDPYAQSRGRALRGIERGLGKLRFDDGYGRGDDSQ